MINHDDFYIIISEQKSLKVKNMKIYLHFHLRFQALKVYKIANFREDEGDCSLRMQGKGKED